MFSNKNNGYRFFDGVFAMGQGVPKLDGLITRTRNDLTVIGGESHREHIFGMRDELTSAQASKIKVLKIGKFLRVQVPQTKSLVPGARKSILTVGRHDDIRDEVTMTME